MQGQQLSLLFTQTSTIHAVSKAQNYIIREEIGKGGAKTKAANNIKAIQLSKKLDAEQRPPTPEEQAILAQYLGWGIAPEVFEEPLKPDWLSLGTQLKELLTPTEYKAKRASIVNAYYTSPTVIREIYRGLATLGFSGDRILEPSMGSGLFLGLAPDSLYSNSHWTGVELDPVTGHIAQQLYPEADIYVRGFQDVMQQPTTSTSPSATSPSVRSSLGC